MNIEDVAAENPDAIVREPVDINNGKFYFIQCHNKSITVISDGSSIYVLNFINGLVSDAF